MQCWIFWVAAPSDDGGGGYGHFAAEPHLAKSSAHRSFDADPAKKDAKDGAKEVVKDAAKDAAKGAGKVRILCLVNTAPSNYRKRAVHVQATWGSRCDTLVFLAGK